MSSSILTPFQRHLTYFAAGPEHTDITILSALRACLALGLNIPFSVAMALTLRFYWAQSVLHPVHIPSIPPGQGPTHLQFASLSQPSYTPDELLQLYECSSARRSGWAGVMDRSHVSNYANWAKGKDGRVKREDVEMFQTGAWQEPIVRRRRTKDHVLPFVYGGPFEFAVSLHSWIVNKVFGIRVYEVK